MAHDEAAWQAKRGRLAGAAFGARTNSEPLDQSGVWAQREWCPSLSKDDIVSMGEGRVPLVPIPRLASALRAGALWVKQCGHNPTGSFKDVGMTACWCRWCTAWCDRKATHPSDCVRVDGGIRLRRWRRTPRGRGFSHRVLPGDKGQRWNQLAAAVELLP